jgi:cell division protein FtsL
MAVTARHARTLAPPARPRLRVVRGTAGARRVPFVLFAAVIVAALVLALTSAQALVAQGAFRMSELQHRVDRLEVEHDLLRLRAARVSSPERIAAAAKRAGLVPRAQVEVLDG